MSSSSASLPPEPALNEQLRQLLEALGCERGRLEANGPSQHLSLAGQRPDGKTVFRWDFAPAFGRAVAGYLAAHGAANGAQFRIEADLRAATFAYATRSPADLAADAAQETAAQRAALRQMLREAPPFGPALARRVADRLRQGAVLSYAHRDYCGTGLAYANGVFTYGAYWDGELTHPLLPFPAQREFIRWLAAQSDESLARLDEPDTWLQFNQTLTTQRLREFVGD